MYKYIFIIIVLVIYNAGYCQSEVITITKEYSYQASELDSKATARFNALKEIKNLVLEEIGVAVFSETKVADNALEKDEIIMLSGGLVSSEILDEKWDGKTYWIKAKLKADTEDTKSVIETLKTRFSASKELESKRKTISKLQSQINDLRKLNISLAEKRKKYEEIIEQISQAAEQYLIGLAFATEAKDYKAAFAWYMRSALNGNAWAQYSVGLAYHEGRGVERDEQKSVYWLGKAAEQNFVEATFALGVAFYYGRGVEKNFDKAFELYSIAASAGHHNAQNNLGNLFMEGEGVRQNKKMAVYWYRKAAERGHPTSLHNLALLYWRGDTVPKDRTEAFRLMKLSAEGGMIHAQGLLGTMYVQGAYGGPPDYIYAYAWYTVAIKNGYSEVVHDRDIVTKFLTPKDIEAALKIADTISSAIAIKEGA